MADPVADNADFAVDELKRKARRRLVGAIVLALAAATILPLLLEQEQKPLGDDVSVQIPPVGSGKFVGRLTEDKAKDAAPGARPDAGAIKAADSGPAAPPASTGPAPTAPAATAEGERAPAAARTEANATPPDAKAEAADAKAESKGGARSSPAAPAAPSPTSAAPGGNPASTPAATAAPAKAADAEASKAERYVVQLGAFTDKYGANALANKLKKSGYPAFTQPVETSKGTLWRVRVGGYATRQAATEARSKLKADGQDGVVTTAK